ncbi:hypothetical protein OVA24_12815 [Luteolibacter sp. SL250]|uniref:hypothetical protein n=1 Tax=Luteolibacter sp. SL250 TaxID=2995170 RepID=UPI00226E0CCF|nr:hypothetical protein [Luteolibacter sp. SL250]WAC18118.1 hypothetical protein OVA24_12815 [Luteolibacter sp. SL250]
MRFLAPLLILLTAISSAQEQMMRKVYETKTDTHVEVTSLFSKPSAEGYFPVRVKVANNQKQGHLIRLKFIATGSYDGGTRAVSEFTIGGPAGKVTTRDILVPLNPVADTYQSSVYLKVEMSGTMGTQTHSVSADYGNEQPSVLLSEPLYSVNASRLDSEAASVMSSFGGGSFTSRFDANQLPDNWLAFSGFDNVIMLDSDWTSMPAGSRNALLSWLRLGGHLVIYSSNSPSMTSLGIPGDTSFGTVSIQSIPGSLNLNATDLLAHLTTGNSLKTHRYSMAEDFGSGWSLFHSFPQKEFRYFLFVIVLLIFGVLVGPINLFVFAKSGRRHLLFITTPIISLCASVILIALILFQDGFGGDGQRLALMEVPAGNGENAAFILQEQVSRTGVLTRANFGIEVPSLFSPVPMEENRWTRFNDNETDGNYSLQPDGAALGASGDWFQSRSMQGQMITSVVPTRGRIERAAGSSELLSTFGFPIEKLFYRDAQGQWFRAESVETGKPFALTSVDESLIRPEIDSLQSEFSRRNSMLFERARERKDHFIAVTAAAPAIETHPGIRWQETRTIITGGIATP